MKIGIFAGTFDPVHIGHISFALESIKTTGLEKIVLLPERQPRGKSAVTDFGHRLNMLKLAAKQFKNLEVLQLPEANFTISETLPQLQKKFPTSQLFLLTGSDVVKSLPRWTNLDELVKNVDIIVGVRQSDDEAELKKYLATKIPGLRLSFANGSYPNMTASQVRAEPRAKVAPGVQDYIKSHNLYAS